MKYRNVSFIGKLQEAVEVLEAAIEDPEFKDVPEDEREALEHLSFKLYIHVNRIYQRRINSEG